MNKIQKIIVAGFVGALLATGSCFAQEATGGDATVCDMEAENPITRMLSMQPIDYQSVKCCYVPAMQAFVAIDSIDCAVDLVVRDGDNMRRIGRFVTDSLYKRHDLKNIHRPVSVSVYGNNIIYLASSAKDSSHIGILRMQTAEDGSLELVKKIGLSYKSYAFGTNPYSGELTVVGNNPQGYSIQIFDIADGAEEMTPKGEAYNYRVLKQAEKIKQSDPFGVGLTVVAVLVVFFALICICMIMKGYAAAIKKTQNRKEQKKAAKEAAKAANNAPTEVVATDVSDDVYAAIAAAIYMYDEEMHDEEDTVITIQKVERAWTPWNAKVYNMNNYFSSRK